MFLHLKKFFSHPASRSIGAVFASSGCILGTWAAMIPFIKEKFGLDEAQLGLLLLCLPAGVTLMNPFTVPLLHRFGAVRLSLVSLVFSAVLFVFPISMPSVWLVAVSLFGTGAAFSTLNVSMNTTATHIENIEKMRIMSACHGLWSSGAWLGSGLAGAAIGLGASHYLVVFGQAVLLAGVSFLLKKNLSTVPEDHHETTKSDDKPTGFAWPTAALWTLIIISLCTNLTEGAMNDWSAVFMRDVVKTSASVASWGFSVYAFFMAAGRFGGDFFVEKYGSRRALEAGGAVAVSGFLLAIIFQNVAASLVGFAMVGAGVSIGAPILYAAAARAPGMARGAGLAVMNTFAMAGFLGGPALIGFLAKIFSLPIAFGFVAAAIGFWIWEARKI